MFAFALTYQAIDETSELHVDHSCGAFHFEAERTGRSTSFTMCCMKIKVHVLPFKEPPAALLRMFADRNNPLHKEFMKDIFKYNNAFAIVV